MTTVIVIVVLLIAALLYLGFYYSPPDLTAYDSPEPALVKPATEISEAHQDVLKQLADYHAQPPTTSATEGRARYAKMFGGRVDFPAVSVDVNGVPGEWVCADNADPANRLLYIHGGAFVVGSPEVYRFITSELSRLTGAAVLAIDYRKRPEHKITDCHDDVRTAYDWIIENSPLGRSPVENLFVAGDSAGGNLTLSVIAWARDTGRRTADGAIGLAPATDSSISSPTWLSNLATDPFLGPSLGKIAKMPKLVLRMAAHLQGGLRAHDPQISPVFGSLAGLPPTLIQVSRDEILYGDALRYANKANSEGGNVELQVWPTLVHVFQGFDNLPEAHDALERIAGFVRGIISEKMNQTRVIRT